MITYFHEVLDTMSIHHNGNKLLYEYFGLSDKPLEINDYLFSNFLKQFFLKPFEAVYKVYQFITTMEILSLMKSIILPK